MNLQPAITILTAHCGHRTALHRALDDNTNTGIRAAAYDREGPSAGSIEPGPMHSDPVGNTATTPDRARMLRNELDGAELTLCDTCAIGDIHRAVRWITDWPQLIHPKTATTIDTAARTIQRITAETLPTNPITPADLAHIADDGDPGCHSCGRIKNNWSDANYNQGRPTNLGGLLPAAWLLCRACYRYTIEHDRPPTTKDLEYRQTNPRGHWPRRHTPAA